MSAYLLEKAIPYASNDPLPLLDATFWFEVSMSLEKSFIEDPLSKNRDFPAGLLKNAGLAHVNLIQAKKITEGKLHGELQLPASYAVFQGYKEAESIAWPVNSRYF